MSRLMLLMKFNGGGLVRQLTTKKTQQIIIERKSENDFCTKTKKWIKLPEQLLQ